MSMLGNRKKKKKDILQDRIHVRSHTHTHTHTQFKKTKIVPNIFSNHNGMKLEINSSGKEFLSWVSVNESD